MPTLARILPWAPSLLSVAVMVETVSLRPPKELVPVDPVVVAVCTQNLELLEPPDREILVAEPSQIASSSQVVVVVLVEQVEPQHQQPPVMVAMA
jgi:hypothetical protein